MTSPQSPSPDSGLPAGGSDGGNGRQPGKPGGRRSGWGGRVSLAAACVLAVVGVGAVTVAATRGPQLPTAPPVGAAASASASGAAGGMASAGAGGASAQATAPARAGSGTASGESGAASGAASGPAQVAGAPGLTYAAALPASRPTRLRISAIGVDTPLIRLGLASDGTMQVPAGPRPAGWFTGSPTPGADGPSVLAGHVTYNGPGVFFRLGQVRPGEQVDVTRADGRVAVFTVYKVETYPKDQFPTAKVYGNTTGPELRIITCAGDYDSSRHHYADNAVVYAALTAEH